ncbi:universal stress protein [Rhodobacteraceae bacterium N5(2021)]|uniref:Universal stress protein n=1 Tax=Gymnodinialimonas phycosphaerae TaxID=2841589 RepID=A0A975TWF4_9RHOB|nr:universal stress protein [Gymnodinialimonas phycosphaerae]MBY4892181.1 universal stress protein [Gymnodinialimonas phycosphaerae]
MSALVLAALDLAHPDHHATLLHKTAQMADLEGADIAVVTVIPDFGMSIVGSFFKEGAEQEALEAAAASLHAVTQDILGQGASARVKHIVRHGTAYEEILDAAEKHGATLIVMGAHRPNFQDYLMGPNAARVARHAKCSVLVLRD